MRLLPTRAERAALSASLGGAVVGMQLAVLSGLLEIPIFAPALFSKSTSRKAALSSAFIAGAVLFSLPAAAVVDILGRRRALLLTGATATAAGHFMAIITISGHSLSFYMFVACRVVAGCSFAVFNIACPMYLSEIAPTPSSRGLFVSLYQLAITVGIVAIQVAHLFAAHVAFASSTSPSTALLAVYRVLLTAEIPAIALTVAVWVAAPESPAWLTSNGRHVEASASRVALGIPETDASKAHDADVLIATTGGSHANDTPGDGSGSEDEDNEGSGDVETGLLTAAGRRKRSALHDIPGSVSDRKRCTSRSQAGPRQARPGFLHLFTDPAARRRMLISTGVQVGQQLSGINCVIFFAPTILTEVFSKISKATGAAVATQSYQAALAIGIFNMFATILSLIVIDRFGRKSLLLAAAGPMAISLMALTCSSVFGLPPAVAVGAILVFIACFAIAWGPVPFLISSEVFGVAIRAKGMTVSSLIMNLVSLSVVTSFLPLHSQFGGSVFIMYAGCIALSAVFVWRKVPETRNLHLDDIDTLIDG